MLEAPADSLITTIAQNGPWALVALLELQVIRVLWRRYDKVQEERLLEKASVVKGLTESTQLLEKVTEVISRRRGGV